MFGSYDLSLAKEKGRYYTEGSISYLPENVPAQDRGEANLTLTREKLDTALDKATNAGYFPQGLTLLTRFFRILYIFSTCF